MLFRTPSPGRQATLLLALFSLAVGSTAGAARSDLTPLQTEAEALGQDANAYSVRFAVDPDEAMWRLKAQQESSTASEAIRRRFASRLAGISLVHQPNFEIRVLLTGLQPVPSEILTVAGRQLPVVYRTGAAATREEAVRAMVQYQNMLRSRLPNARGMGHDQKSGEIVLLVTRSDAQRHGLAGIKAHAESIAKMPVRVEIVQRQTNLGIHGGGRVEGVDPSDGKRYSCTTGFVVTNGTQHGILTAAHCPNQLVFRDIDGSQTPLSFDGQWGWRYRDVQLHVSPQTLEPSFYSDRRSGTRRLLTSWRNRTTLRAGEWLCHYGESSGYSCEVVELTDYAPPGELCGGPCATTWVTVSGPICKSGDSGGPVFLGTIAFGITKGGSSTPGGACNFYYFMSTDFLPDGWRLLHAGDRVKSSGNGSGGGT